MKKFDEVMNKLSGKEDKYTIFNDFLDYAIAFSELDIRKAKPVMEYIKDKYGDDKDLFFELYDTWINQMQEYLKTKNHYDMLGDYYINYIQSSNKATERGQFFTPQCVTDAMALLTNDPDNTGFIYDCAGGSGRTLLASHDISPRAVCVSWDLDIMSCKICALNFLVHGVTGAVVHCNSLTQEFFTGWKINECINILGYDGLGIMETESMFESHCFIGKPFFKPKECVNVNTGNDNRIPASKGQVTLGEF